MAKKKIFITTITADMVDMGFLVIYQAPSLKHILKQGRYERPNGDIIDMSEWLQNYDKLKASKTNAWVSLHEECLLALCLPNKLDLTNPNDLGTMVHEISHIVQHITEYISAEREHEMRAYMTEYMFKSLYLYIKECNNE